MSDNNDKPDDPLDDLEGTVDDDILEAAQTGDVDSLSAAKSNDDEESTPSETEETAEKLEEAKEAGDKAAGLYLAPFQAFFAMLVGIGVGISRRIPGRTRIQMWMVETGIEGMWRTSDAHMICMTIYGDRAVVPRPAQLDSEDGKLKTNNGEEWSVEEVQPCRLGDAPVVWGVADDHELTAPVAARIAEAVDRDWRNVQAVKETSEGISPADYQSPQQAVADGGVANREPFDDVWIDARNSNRNADGMIVSMSKAYDLHWSQSSSEEMKKQEDRGRLAEMDPEKYENRGIKMLIVAGIAFSLGLFGPALARRIAGAGGDGGSTVPLFIEPLQLALTGLGVM